MSSNPNGFPRRVERGLQAAYTWQYGPSDARNLGLAGSSANGTLVGGASASSGKLTLDGVGDYVSAASGITTYSTPFSIAGWFNIDSIAATKFILSINETVPTAGDGLRIFYRQPSGKLRFDSFDPLSGTSAITESATSISASTWYHFCITHDSGTTKMYVAGSLETTTSLSALQPHSYSALRIGSWSQDSSFDFPGDMGETRIYSRVLTSTEISEIYQSTRGDYA